MKRGILTGNVGNKFRGHTGRGAYGEQQKKSPLNKNLLTRSYHSVRRGDQGLPVQVPKTGGRESHVRNNSHFGKFFGFLDFELFRWETWFDSTEEQTRQWQEGEEIEEFVENEF
jgi:hypothetical protein